MTVELIHGDCMDYMRSLPDNAFELAIVDPPYGIGNWVQTSGNVRGKPVTWNDKTPEPEYFKQLLRVSKEQIIWGANYYNQFNQRGGAIVWNKHVPRESNMSVCEIASYSRLKRVDYIDLIWQNINRNETVIHECQKPVKLYQILLQRYAKPGDRILDTHLGSGSSAIAAHYAGHDFVGIELDPDYYAAAKKRFEENTKQIDIFSEAS